MAAPQIPVYLFTGFLEAGKTKFIQETLEDPRFNSDKERTLLLLCEEGEEEYDPARFYDSKNVFIETLDDPEQINEVVLTGLIKKHRTTRVVMEYNGMWMLQDLYNRMPENWIIYQEFMLCDANTFLSYNQNMRQLVVDKLSSCEIVVFNRAPMDVDKETFHKIVRGVSRRTDIAYEHLDGTVEYDEIEDPLPFDIEAPVIEIDDRDFALFYRDISEEPKKYNGKTVKFKGLVALDKRFPKGMIAIGRFVMTCCEADTQFMSFLCQVPKDNQIAHKDWLTITATIAVKNHPLYKGEGPVLTATSIEKTEAPVQEIATFY